MEVSDSMLWYCTYASYLKNTVDTPMSSALNLPLVAESILGKVLELQALAVPRRAGTMSQSSQLGASWAPR